MLLLELVPRDQETLEKEAQESLSDYLVDGINIPDVLRLPIRSTDAVLPLLEKSILAIPHIRTIDHSIDTHLENTKKLVKSGLKKILFVTGDPPDDTNFKTYNVSPIDLIKETKKAFPTLDIYGGLDPYRQSFEKEVAYAEEKINAGAKGLFTQPFFDTDLTKRYLDQFKQAELFIGLSPVCTEKSLQYWQTRNKVTFPDHFNTGLEYNCALARDIITLTKSYNQHNYLMPIRISVKTYLEGIFERVYHV
jgi:methylenetetrahydrofolate reductase (NADPH)